MIPEFGVIDVVDGMVITKEFTYSDYFTADTAGEFAARRNAHQIDQSFARFVVVRLEVAS